MDRPFVEDVQRRKKFRYSPFNSLLINQSHHKLKHLLTSLLPMNVLNKFMHSIKWGLNRVIDIVAFKKNSHEAYISYYIDPTIRYETNAIDQADDVNEE